MPSKGRQGKTSTKMGTETKKKTNRSLQKGVLLGSMMMREKRGLERVSFLVDPQSGRSRGRTFYGHKGSGNFAKRTYAEGSRYRKNAEAGRGRGEGSRIHI